MMEALVRSWRNRAPSITTNTGMLEGMIASIVLCGFESSVLNTMERNGSVYMKFLRRTLGVNVRDRIRNKRKMRKREEYVITNGIATWKA